MDTPMAEDVEPVLEPVDTYEQDTILDDEVRVNLILLVG
jgi:hypothetical protein